MGEENGNNGEEVVEAVEVTLTGEVGWDVVAQGVVMVLGRRWWQEVLGGTWWQVVMVLEVVAVGSSSG